MFSLGRERGEEIEEREKIGQTPMTITEGRLRWKAATMGYG